MFEGYKFIYCNTPLRVAKVNDKLVTLEMDRSEETLEMGGEKYFTVPAVADLTGYAKSHIYNLIRWGELKGTRQGGRLLIPESEMRAKLNYMRG